MDQKISKYSCRLLTHRWTMIHFFFLMDTIWCNAMVIHAIKHKKPLRKSNSFDIVWEFVLSLVRPLMAARPTVGWGQALKNKIAIFVLTNLLQDLLIVIRDTPKESKDVPYVSPKPVVLTTEKKRIT